MQNCARRGMQLEKASAINWLFVQNEQVSNFLLSDPQLIMSNPFLTSGIPESCNPMFLLVRRSKSFQEVPVWAISKKQSPRLGLVSAIWSVLTQLYAWTLQMFTDK